MSDLGQILELLQQQNEMRVKDREEDEVKRHLMAKEIKQSVKEEINAVIKPWQERTEAVEEKTNSMETNISKLLQEVAGLKEQITSKQVRDRNWAAVAGAEGSGGTGAVLTGANAIPLGRTTLEDCENDYQKTEDADNDDRIKEVLGKARRTLGFGPIKSEDIARQYKESSMFGRARNENDAKMMSVMELMLCDMKISKAEQQNMEIVRVFAPQRDNADMLYCEFRSMSSVFTVFKHTRNMRRGTNVSSYIPKEYYEQYRALEEICFKWRKEEGYRTRVRMGREGLEVWRKRGVELVYSQVPLAVLGELPPVTVLRREVRQENRSLTSSPPVGRPGYTPPKKKRPRSMSQSKSPSSRSPPGKKPDESTREGVEGGEEGEEEKSRKALEQADLVKDPSISPVPAGQGLLKVPDLGRVVTVQATTPSKQITNLANDTYNHTSSPIYRKNSISA